MKRLEERRKARLFAELGSTMKLPRSGPSKLSLEVIELADQERPPMIRIPEYAERRAAADQRPEPDGGVQRGLRVLVAPDSFKGSLTPSRWRARWPMGWQRARPPRRRSDSIPLADGGEGTLEAIKASGPTGWSCPRTPAIRWAGHRCDVPAPRRRPVSSSWPRLRAFLASRRPSATPLPLRRSAPARCWPRRSASACGMWSSAWVASATTDGGSGLLDGARRPLLRRPGRGPAPRRRVAWRISRALT